MTRHTWPPKGEWHSILSCECGDGIEKLVRQCIACNITKETVMVREGNAFTGWHEWITSSGERWVGETTPPCIPKGQPVEMKRT